MEWAVPALVLISLFTAAAASYALHLSISAKIQVEALKNSTHQVQFVPVEDSLNDKEDDEVNKQIDRHEARAYAEMDDIHHASEPLM